MASTIVPTLLNRKNYDDWSSRIVTYLLAEDLWDIVEGTYDYKDEALWKKDVKALYAIQKSCGDDMYKIIKSKTTAKDAWDALVKTLKPGSDRSSVKKDMRAIDEAYPQTDTRIASDMEAGPTRGPDDDRENFVKCVKSKDWFEAFWLLREHSQLGREKFSFEGTALHQAVQPFSNCRMRRMEGLVESMEKEDLEIKDTFGRTALYLLIREYPERVEVARSMVAKNDKLLTILPYDKKEPLFVEAERQEKGGKMARYLYPLTAKDTIRVTDGAQLISLGFRHQRFDIAWKLIQHYPQLAVSKDNDGDIPLVTLASNRLAFLSGSRLNLWEKMIYYGIWITPLPLINESDHSDKGSLIFSVRMGLLRVWRILQKLLENNRVYEIKLMHKRVSQFLPLMCNTTKDTHVIELLKAALCVAAERGHVEYITHLSEIDESFLSSIKNEKGQSLFQIAAESRHFQVIHADLFLQGQDTYGQVRSDRMRDIVGRRDSYGNNMLHTLASVTPLSKIDHIRGAVLQMQNELRWFKEMESHAYPNDREYLNDDNMTPREVFTDNHKEMGKEAERSMKETATSCTVVGALIVTIMFAAAFTVPGGNDEKTGLPKFITKKVFRAFIVSDAISLFSSTTSVIMFLGILTSRYSEDDFLKSLPTKMIIGLFTLFLSITNMMIVFSCALYIMLDGKLSVLIPNILLASVPVTSFIWMQFPLLVELFNSTFGRAYLLCFKKLVCCIHSMCILFVDFYYDCCC
ncbi:uncharacterized protein [Malus domestica]|uniref:uncharacterized protein n=1 Tax=Malus domestica TaxID=3750 RepID=UPI0010AAB594|nr:uncharacterized protein LOC103429157 [Malus domestica]XP_028963755.1 uncharacterized protein LOC103429157 [Malus domestica]